MTYDINKDNINSYKVIDYDLNEIDILKEMLDFGIEIKTDVIRISNGSYYFLINKM